jgi:hypothetical protein
VSGADVRGRPVSGTLAKGSIPRTGWREVLALNRFIVCRLTSRARSRRCQAALADRSSVTPIVTTGVAAVEPVIRRVPLR